MVIHRDFTATTDVLRWIDRGDLIEVVPGQRFRTPDHFYEDTLSVFISGVRVERNNDDGFVIVDDQTFQLNAVYPLPRFRVSVGYIKKTV